MTSPTGSRRCRSTMPLTPCFRSSQTGWPTRCRRFWPSTSPPERMVPPRCLDSQVSLRMNLYFRRHLPRAHGSASRSVAVVGEPARVSAKLARTSLPIEALAATTRPGSPDPVDGRVRHHLRSVNAET